MIAFADLVTALGRDTSYSRKDGRPFQHGTRNLSGCFALWGMKGMNGRGGGGMVF